MYYGVERNPGIFLCSVLRGVNESREVFVQVYSKQRFDQYDQYRAASLHKGKDGAEMVTSLATASSLRVK